MGLKATQAKSVGSEMASLIPQDGKRWWQRPHLLQLNLYLFSLFLLSAANGYDGSMMNGESGISITGARLIHAGLQALPQWHEFMKMPT